MTKALVMLPLVAMLATACARHAIIATPTVSQVPTAATSTSLRFDNIASLADRQRWYLAARWPKDCEDSYAAVGYSPDFGGLTFYELSPGTYLLQVTCYLGAYQGESVFLIVKRDSAQPDARLVNLQVYSAEDNNIAHLTSRHETSVMGVPSFDDKTKTLTIFNKSRGIGDCGIITVYDFSGASINPPVKHVSAELTCSGKPFSEVK